MVTIKINTLQKAAPIIGATFFAFLFCCSTMAMDAEDTGMEERDHYNITTIPEEPVPKRLKFKRKDTLTHAVNSQQFNQPSPGIKRKRNSEVLPGRKSSSAPQTPQPTRTLPADRKPATRPVKPPLKPSLEPERTLPQKKHELPRSRSTDSGLSLGLGLKLDFPFSISVSTFSDIKNLFYNEKINQEVVQKRKLDFFNNITKGKSCIKPTKVDRNYTMV